MPPPRSAPKSARPCWAATSSSKPSNGKAWRSFLPIPAARAWRFTSRSPTQRFAPSSRAMNRAAVSRRKVTRARPAKAGVCMGTSGPGATNLVTAIADALHGFLSAHRHHRSGKPGHDRARRVSGDGHHRRHAADRETFLSHHQRERHRARGEGGVLHRAIRPARPGGD